MKELSFFSAHGRQRGAFRHRRWSAPRHQSGLMLLAQMAPYVHFPSVAACSEHEVGEYDRQRNGFRLG